MPLKNRKLAKEITKRACDWCGWSAGPRHAAHIVDEQHREEEWNVLSLCPNCSSVFDDKIRPRLHEALERYGCVGLPISWKTDTKTRGIRTEDLMSSSPRRISRVLSGNEAKAAFVMDFAKDLPAAKRVEMATEWLKECIAHLQMDLQHPGAFETEKK